MLDIDIANERILKEYIDGPTIYDLVKNDAMKDLYLMQMREMAKVVYEAGLNIDYFPTNFIVQDEKIFYIGSSLHFGGGLLRDRKTICQCSFGRQP